jgi:predicted HAD superfamily hydrolase
MHRLNLEGLLNCDAKVFSFDVFDTVITRATAQPTGVFACVQNRLSSTIESFPDCLFDQYYDARIAAEDEARRQSSWQEIRLDEIFDVIQRRFSLSRLQRELIIALEVEEEANVIRPVPQILTLLNRLRKKDARIVFTTDTYLPSDIVTSLLRQVGAYEDGDGIYVSADRRLTKFSGDLFGVVMKEECCASNPNLVIHIGDNEHSDFRAPRRKGIRAFLFSQVLLNRYERKLAVDWRKNRENRAIWQLMSGSSRLARIQCTTSERKSALYNLGANVAGPVLLGYVLWVLTEAKRRSINRIYFLARDGQILLMLAREIAARLGWDFDLRYLYASRQAWHLPAASDIGPRELGWLLEEDPILSIRILSRRMRIDVSILQAAVEAKIGKHLDPDQQLMRNEIEEVGRVLREDPVRSYFLNRASEERKVTIAYFRQMGLLDSVPFAIVDLGWFGRLQDSLDILLARKGTTHVLGFYFGLERRDYSDRKFSFFFGPEKAEPYRAIGSAMIGILEIFTAADHGSTLGYARGPGGEIVPLLGQPRNNSALQWGLAILREGILSYTRLTQPSCLFALAKSPDTYRYRILEIMALLRFHPSKEEADVLGDFPFSSDQASTYYTNFAPRLSVTDALRYVSALGSTRRSKFTWWIEGSCKRGDVPTRLLLSASMIRPWLGRRRWKYRT